MAWSHGSRTTGADSGCHSTHFVIAAVVSLAFEQRHQSWHTRGDSPYGKFKVGNDDNGNDCIYDIKLAQENILYLSKTRRLTCLI